MSKPLVYVRMTLALAMLSAVMPAKAQDRTTVANFLKDAKTNENTAMIIEAAARGLEGANVYLEVAGRPLLYCVPKSLIITGDQYVQIVTDHIARFPEMGDYPASMLGLVLVASAAKSFPCKTN